jgi:hypothetical protein
MVAKNVYIHPMRVGVFFLGVIRPLGGQTIVPRDGGFFYTLE